MNSKEEINNLKQIRTINSSEISSDISDDNTELSYQTDKLDFILDKKDSLKEEYIHSKNLKEKRTRFNSENVENNIHSQKMSNKLDFNELKIKRINKQLRNIANGELAYLKKRKFTFS